MCSGFAHKKIWSVVEVDSGTHVRSLTVLYRFIYVLYRLKVCVMGL